MFIARGAIVPSDSDNSVKYTVFVGQHAASCTCKAFRYHPDRNCKHLLRFIGAAITDMQEEGKSHRSQLEAEITRLTAKLERVERTARYQESVGGPEKAKLHDAYQAGFAAGEQYNRVLGD